jgi:DNA-binding beta-propeller fold protein YncE
MRRTRTIVPLVGLFLFVSRAGGAQAIPDATYWAYVAAESADLVHLVEFGPRGARVARTIPVGENPVETEGPHGLRVSRDGRYLYMTTGHGIPDGKLWKIETGADTVVDRPTLLGYFPATVDLTPDGLYAFVANFNLHGEHIPSSVSVVYTPTLTEVTQTETCVMPHGARMHPSGDFLYSACMMDDEIVEIDTHSFDVARRGSGPRGRARPDRQRRRRRPSGIHLLPHLGRTQPCRDTAVRGVQQGG